MRRAAWGSRGASGEAEGAGLWSPQGARDKAGSMGLGRLGRGAHAKLAFAGAVTA